MIDKVIVLANKEDRQGLMERLYESAVKISVSLGSFILIEEPTSAQITELESHGIEVQTIEDGVGDLSQFDEEDQFLMGAYLLRKSPDYQATTKNADLSESEEQREMLECNCEEEH